VRRYWAGLQILFGFFEVQEQPGLAIPPVAGDAAQLGDRSATVRWSGSNAVQYAVRVGVWNPMWLVYRGNGGGSSLGPGEIVPDVVMRLLGVIGLVFGFGGPGLLAFTAFGWITEGESPLRFAAVWGLAATFIGTGWILRYVTAVLTILDRLRAEAWSPPIRWRIGVHTDTSWLPPRMDG
jgi:hypothetical protein